MSYSYSYVHISIDLFFISQKILYIKEDIRNECVICLFSK